MPKSSKTLFDRCSAALVLALAGTLGALSPAASAEISMPVPSVVIYPGDTIRLAMLAEQNMPETFGAQGGFIRDPALILGKVARRTLLPNQPIPAAAISEPKVVANGAMVRVVFKEGGLTISTYASALQAGSVGEVIPVRNIETGLIISGVVQADGTVSVSNG